MGRGGFGYHGITLSSEDGKQRLTFTEDMKNLYVGNYKRESNSYETQNFSFDLDTCEAYSYRWWKFVTKAEDGTIYFNAYGYSNSTYGHQAMASNILRIEGAKFKTVYVEKGLTPTGIQHELHKLNVAIVSAEIGITKQDVKPLKKEYKTVLAMYNHLYGNAMPFVPENREDLAARLMDAAIENQNIAAWERACKRLDKNAPNVKLGYMYDKLENYSQQIISKEHLALLQLTKPYGARFTTVTPSYEPVTLELNNFKEKMKDLVSAE